MNVLISTDLEGIPGVTSIEDMERGTERYENACRKLEQTLNWVIDACVENGAENIYYSDGHGGGGNIKEENIDPRARKPKVGENLTQEGKIDCRLEVGAHARAGTLGGFLDHTFNSKVIFEYLLNGEPCSELSFAAAISGFYNVPCVLCIGDRVACEQAKEYIPEIRTAVVKEGTERNLCHDLPNAEQIIREAVADALQNYRNIPIYKLSLPITVQQTTYRTDSTDLMYKAMMEKGRPVERLDARTLRMVVTEKPSNWMDLRFWV